MSLVEDLVESDRLEDQGEWEEAAWRRLEAFAATGLSPGKMVVVHGIRVGSDWCGIHVLLDNWRWFRWSKLEPRGWTCFKPRDPLGPWQRIDQPPDEIRQAVEEAAAQAVAAALAHLST